VLVLVGTLHFILALNLLSVPATFSHGPVGLSLDFLSREMVHFGHANFPCIDPRTFGGLDLLQSRLEYSRQLENS
jgi:hypothetical protein